MIFEKIVGIAACDPRGVMGIEGKLPWHSPEELAHFAKTIGASSLIMGYKTFLSLPKHYMKGRTTIIFTKQQRVSTFTNQRFVTSLHDFFHLPDVFQTLYLIGGAQIFHLFFQENLINEFLLTKFRQEYEGDTFFPLSFLKGWHEYLVQKNALFTIHRYTQESHARRCL